MIIVPDREIVPADYMVKLNTGGAGSVVIHLGVCKSDPEGRQSEGVTFERAGDVESELEGVEQKLREDFDILDVVLAKRAGKVPVGGIILFAAVAAKDRVNSFGACEAAVEHCKKLKTLKKTEHFTD